MKHEKIPTKSSIRQIEIQAKSRVLDLFQGMYRSVFKGRGIEFEDLREYVPGDDIRAISWKKMAQTGRPFTKNFQEERDLTILLAIDVSASENFGSHFMTKREKVAEVAALLSFAAISNHDRVGLLLFSDRIEKYIPPKRGLRHGMRLVQEFLGITPKGRGTDLNQALSFLYQVTKKPCVAFLISDFQAKEYSKPLQLAAKKDDLILIRIADPEELELPNLGLTHFYDPETEASFVVDVNSTTQKSYREQYEAFYKQFREIVKKAGVSAIELNTNSRYEPILKAFFDARRRRRW